MAIVDNSLTRTRSAKFDKGGFKQVGFKNAGFGKGPFGRF